MTDAEGSHRQAHVGASGPNDNRTLREKARRPAGRAAPADGVQQSAKALHESSHSILATLEVEMFHWQKILQRERLNNGFF